MPLEPTRKPYKPKRCANEECHKQFTPLKRFQKVCDWHCGLKWIEQQRERKVRGEIKERKQTLKTKSDWTKEAQIAFNAFIRARDREKPCICCERLLGLPGVGGGFDCGHYRSVGSAPHLRFDERNAHGQTKQCNRYGAGRAVDYRIGLIDRIGLEAVEALEADNAPAKWNIEQLKEIRDKYRNKLKELKQRRES